MRVAIWDYAIKGKRFAPYTETPYLSLRNEGIYLIATYYSPKDRPKEKVPQEHQEAPPP